MRFSEVFYEPDSLNYPLGIQLKEKYASLPWHSIENHNRIDEMRQKQNAEFARMKRYLIIGTRKTHRYTENHKISDFLVPWTSSGCTAMCLYCYLVCHYNKCSYLRLFVNREQMMSRLCAASQKSERPLTYEIGSNSDLLLENTITGNLEWAIPDFAENGRGYLTFPTKFHQVEPLLSLDHRGKTIFRMSVNPEEVIRKIELGASPLKERVEALNKMRDAGYPCGILIAPVILIDGWRPAYEELLDYLAENLSLQTKEGLTVEIIFMTYSYIHRVINREAFPNAPELYDPDKMSGRGPGKYFYKGGDRDSAESFLREEVSRKLPKAKLLYIC